MERRILIVDDEPDIRETLGGVLEDEGYAVKAVASGEDALRVIRHEPPDLVMLDIWMPGIDGLQTLAKIKERDPDLHVIMISGHGNIETAVKAIKMGAYDFIEKPLSLPEITLTVKRMMELLRLEEEHRRLTQTIDAKHEMLGEHPSIQALRDQIALAAPTDGWVLITGENGTGKELVARQIHMRSKRAAGPFVEVNCAAIPEDLIESELFGHEKGAFTGAIERRRGKFDTADGGTIFLDEIADMSLKTQAKVLRVLQEQRFERVGGTEPVDVDVRVIAATNKSLEAQIAAGLFREDLYYRLNVIPLHVPPLRERRQDIPLFVEFFARAFCTRSGLPPRRFTDQAVERLGDYDWPGNVRELKNVVERLVILTRGEEVDAEQAAQALRPAAPRAGVTEELFDIDDLREAKAAFEREFLQRKLEEFDGNITKTAEALGIERTNLHRKIKSLGIVPPREE
jgi:two-component system nitrogen regulation response regulator NtrX